ncbi:MAG: CDP-alcohol phosphatidyltransferase family protein [Clostridiales bacterium]|nr:CDP-alcohol phosphatidyltransferase family protein [Clostridiales bacterium]
MKAKWKQNLNVPNTLTMLRMLMIPVYIALFLNGHKYWALFTFLLAGATDVADGMIARKFDLITDFGKLMDPLADKLMGLTALLSMTIGTERIPAVVPWAVVIVILGKEALMMLGGLAMLGRHIVVYSKPIGKAAQFLLTVGLTAAYFHEQLAGLWAWEVSPDVLLLYAATAVTLIALCFYAASCVKQLRAQNNDEVENGNETKGN